MHAEVEGSSPPPQGSPSGSGQITSSNGGTLLPLPSHVQTTTKGHKRKRAQNTAAAASPAPSDNTAGGGNTNEVLGTSRADLSSRPILTISRGPVFIPVTEGSEWFKTDQVAVNRVGYRYIPAGIRPAGSAMACRTIESNPTCFRVSWEDRSPFIKVTKDGLGLAGSKGFRSARCNAPMREGKWYMEVKILHGGGEHVSEESRREGGHVRLGWGRREASLNGPVGLDGYSYGYRDKTGDKVTLSRPRPYGRPFGTGDVVGMYISLPPRRQPDENDPHDPAHLKRERIPIELNRQEVFEILEYPQSKEMTSLMDYSGKTTSSASVPSSNKKPANGKLPERNGPAVSESKPPTPNLRPLPTLRDSCIAYFVNGESQGIAFEDLYDYLPLRQTEAQKANSRRRMKEGEKSVHKENPFDDGTLGYYPFISLFNDASVRLNPGPDFEFPPPDDIDTILRNPKPAATETKVDTTSSTATAAESVAPAEATGASTQTVDEASPMDLDAKPEDVKPIIDPETSTVVPPAPVVPKVEPDAQQENKPQIQRTWRPACERYPEFMQEEWAFDELEEARAQVELEKHAAAEKAEEDRRKQREKKRQQAEARRKAKAAAAKQLADAALLEEEKAREKEKEMEMKERETKFSSGLPLSPTPISSGMLLGPGGLYAGNYPSPSPLRHSTAYEPTAYEAEGSINYENSPAPTFASYGEYIPEAEPEGSQSGYTTENQELPDDMDVDQHLEALLDAPSRVHSPSTTS
ncbi:hypothetical protein CPC08DRAFT_704080 [Agrocybe pediades]|nr:hypothetical protein CPC08DRAFT_704080 [Agrocybe pediades]